MRTLRRTIPYILIWLYQCWSNGSRAESLLSSNFLLTASFSAATLLAAYYVHIVASKFLKERTYWQLLLSVLGVALVFPFFRYSIEELLYPITFHIRNYTEGVNLWYYIKDNTHYVITPIFMGFAFNFAEDWFINRAEKQELINEKNTTELAFLKSQVNPHFLFNTLNNIYSLTFQKSEKAPEAVLKLSEMMRYMLYESNETKVSLNQEVKYLQNFIDLQKMRYHGETFIEFNVQGDINYKQIAPLLLIPFVENAFKHGEVSNSLNPLIINLLVSNNNLHFSVQNHKKDQNKDEVGGVGLENMQRRLALLYSENYGLEVKEEKDSYYCELNLML
jgi:two-component system, LytTR family, sensor kinase